jgi:hypothetical protein
MSKLKQTKIPVELEEIIDSRPTPNYKLVREHDGLTKHSDDVAWLEWDENDSYVDKHQDIALGRSLLMSPFSPFYFTWQTTVVTEIVEQREDYIKFKTKNSNYELFKL